MKIAVVWKWWSGKSTVTTLLAKNASKEYKKVTVFDADFNCDTAYNLWRNDENPWKVFTQWFDNFFEHIWVWAGTAWKELYEKCKSKNFSISPYDDFTNQFVQQTIYPQLDLIVWWLLSEEIVFANKCSHAYFKPIKYYLWWVKTNKDSLMIFDSVAWTDMVGYGLYLWIDYVICIVEPTNASKWVYRNVKKICSLFKIPVYQIINKADENIVYQDNDTLWVLYKDINLINLKSEISTSNQKSIQRIVSNIKKLPWISQDKIDARYALYHEKSQRK